MVNTLTKFDTMSTWEGWKNVQLQIQTVYMLLSIRRTTSKIYSTIGEKLKFVNIYEIIQYIVLILKNIGI